MIDEWQKILDQWKSEEAATSLIVLTDMVKLKIVLWAFMQADVTWEPTSAPPDDVSPGKLWVIAWRDSKYSNIDMAILVNVTPKECALMMHRLIHARLAYPDGTIHAGASKFINAHILKRIKGAVQ